MKKIETLYLRRFVQIYLKLFLTYNQKGFGKTFVILSANLSILSLNFSCQMINSAKMWNLI